MSSKETSLEENDLTNNGEFLKNLLCEIEEYNKEAVSRSSSSRSYSSSTASDIHSSINHGHSTVIQDIQEELQAPNVSSILNLSIHEELNEEEQEEMENVNSEQKCTEIGYNTNFSESWINATLPNTKHISSSTTAQHKKKTPPQCDAKVKISIPLETYKNTPLHTALTSKRPALINLPNINGDQNVRNDSLETLEKVTIANCDYLILSLLGQGGHSKVYSCIESVKNNERAIKKISCNAKITTNLLNEVEIMRHLSNCDNVIKLYNYDVCDKYLYIVLERGYCNLSVIIKEYYYNNNRLPLYKLMFYWMEILNAVKQIHDRHIAHLDLKLSNFVQCKNCIKLIDFGTAVIVNDDNYAIKYDQIGSANYICPEAVTNVASTICDNLNDNNIEMYKVTLKSDVWSLGCILYELIYKRPPFHHILTINDKLIAITNPEHKINYPTSTGTPHNLLEVIQICLVHNSTKRPTIDELLDNLNKYKIEI